MRCIVSIAAMAVIFILAAPAALAETVSEEEAGRAWEESVRELRLQTNIPEAEAPKLPEIEFEPWAMPDLSAAARLLLWGSLAALLAVIIFKLTDAWRNGPRRAALTAEGEDGQEIAPGAVAARMDQAQLEAEELARRGLFAQAMHVLLLRSLNEMRLRLGLSLAISLTSREIVRSTALGQHTRAALADLVGRVEVSYFGEHEAGEAEYLASRQSFEVFSHNLKAGGQA